ncbi:hypothetical protein [Ochrovirga pacifica]|uniref:hypothetical protein n=1 Tax=Ochrovirga pacifica TaxID=1042376 RepID=UPI0002F63296|nr:hypothetical protein [Ochrovirga pacifica]
MELYQKIILCAILILPCYFGIQSFFKQQSFEHKNCIKLTISKTEFIIDFMTHLLLFVLGCTLAGTSLFIFYKICISPYEKATLIGLLFALVFFMMTFSWLTPLCLQIQHTIFEWKRKLIYHQKEQKLETKDGIIDLTQEFSVTSYTPSKWLFWGCYNITYNFRFTNCNRKIKLEQHENNIEISNYIELPKSLEAHINKKEKQHQQQKLNWMS